MDLFMQFSHQSHCYRAIQFYEDKTSRVFPADGFGTQATEIGPRFFKTGPCLVKFTGVFLSQSEVLSWLQNSILERFVLRLYWVEMNQLPAPSKEALYQILNTLKPPAANVRLQTRPASLESDLGAMLPMSWTLDPKNFSRVLYVIETEEGFHWGINSAKYVFLRAPDLKRQSSLYPSRAVHKIQEALFHANLEDLSNFNCAIDLGAAPGSWSVFLAERVKKVIAVDKGKMMPEAQLSNITHICKLAEDSRDDIHGLLQGQDVDLLVSDMNMHICDALAPIEALAPFLKSGGLMIITMKFFGKGRKPKMWEDRTRDRFRELGFTDCKIVWLFANTVNERTLLALKEG